MPHTHFNQDIALLPPCAVQSGPNTGTPRVTDNTYTEIYMTYLHKQQGHLIATIYTTLNAAPATNLSRVMEVRKCELFSDLIVIVCLCKNVN
jgi:hypothetical protein